MYRGSTVGVVVPAYNEEGLVGDVIETVPRFVDRVYVVDDCSTDDTWNEIRDTLRRIDESDSIHDGVRPITDGAGASHDDAAIQWRDRIAARDSRGDPTEPDRRIVALRHRENAGVGGAIKTGYRNAMDDPEGIEVMAVMSGDGQMDPGILDRIIDPIVTDLADYAKGNRLRHTEYRHEMSAWRTFGNVLLTGLTRIASGYWQMVDPQNGYTAISREALTRVEFESLYDDYGFCNHLLVRLNRQRLRIADVPMRALYGDETSNIRYETFVPGLSLLLLRGYLGRLLEDATHGFGEPTSAAQLLGIAVIVAGLGAGTLSPLFPATLSTSAVLLTIGLVSFVVGVVTERRRNAELEFRVDSEDLPWESSVGSNRAPSTNEPQTRED